MSQMKLTHVRRSEVRILPLQASNGSRTAVTGAVVDNPKDPMGVPVRSLGHDLFDQAVEGDNGAAGFATPIDFGSVDIPGSQIGPGSEASILMLDLDGRVSLGRQRGVATLAGLDGGFLIGAQDELIRAQGLTFPKALVEIEQEIGYQPLESGVLLPQLLQFPDLGRLQAAILLLPAAKDLLRNA